MNVNVCMMFIYYFNLKMDNSGLFWKMLLELFFFDGVCFICEILLNVYKNVINYGK